MLLPLVWLATLAGSTDVLATNAFRVAGALLAGASAWIWHRRERSSLSVGRVLAMGVVGSLAVTALSVALPALGRFTVSGWLVSGIVGGGMVALAVHAAGKPLSIGNRGGAHGRQPSRTPRRSQEESE